MRVSERGGRGILERPPPRAHPDHPAGVPSAYLVDVETYELLQRRMTLLEGIARGEKAIEEGRTVPQAEAKKRMSRWLK